MLVDLAEGGQEAVGVVVGDHVAAVVLDLEAVVGDLRLIEHADPDAFVLVGHRRPWSLPALMVIDFAIGRIVRIVTCLLCGCGPRMSCGLP